MRLRAGGVAAGKARTGSVRVRRRLNETRDPPLLTGTLSGRAGDGAHRPDGRADTGRAGCQLAPHDGQIIASSSRAVRRAAAMRARCAEADRRVPIATRCGTSRGPLQRAPPGGASGRAAKL